MAISITCPTCSSRAWQQPMATKVRVGVSPHILLLSLAWVGSQGFELPSLYLRAVLKGPLDALVRAYPSFLKAGLPQE